MKQLADLKRDLLDDKVERFYVFYGEDFGIRRHYIERIKTYFEQVEYVDSYNGIGNIVTAKSLFTIKKLIIINDDMEFAKLKAENINKFIRNIKEDFTCIFIYDDEGFEKSSLYKNASQYITNFQVVESKIAIEFVNSELSLLNKSAEELANNCNNNYSNILLESDKIRNYANAKNISEQSAYEALRDKKQLITKQEDFKYAEFTNNLITGNFHGLIHSCKVLQSNGLEADRFFNCLPYMFNDLLIAGICCKYGKYEGSKIIYNQYNLSWGRTKEIREMEFKYSPEDYFETAYFISDLDIKVRKNEITREDALDYFFSYVI